MVGSKGSSEFGELTLEYREVQEDHGRPVVTT